MATQPDTCPVSGMQANVVQPASNRFRGLLLSALSLTLLTTPLYRAQADQAQDVLKKMGDVYRNAKSFEGTVSIRQKGKGRDGKPASVTTTQSIKYKSPNLFVVDLKASATGGTTLHGNTMGE